MVSRGAVTELYALLPPAEPATLLMNTYFDRIHWFMLLFHQDEFRQVFQNLWTRGNETSLEALPPLGSLSTALAVCAISLQYVGAYRRMVLARCKIDPPILRDRILSGLGRRFLEILALGSLETVQTCVLLGTYYLYHGQPDLAWPICGCGLRIAQAIGLHRHVDISSTLSTELWESHHRANEARKRCWWAVYEIETFCSMLYGLPLSIMDSDCNVEYLNPLAQSSTLINSRNTDNPSTAANAMLFYKPMMSKLSVIVKSALTDLYKIRLDSVAMKNDSTNRTAALGRMVQKVQDLDSRLSTWSGELPPELRLPCSDGSESTTYSDEELEFNIGASGPKFEALILRLQALALKLAYENAKILIHRPLLTYRMVAPLPAGERVTPSSRVLDPCQLSVQACREAALRTSELGALETFQRACQTYAVAFIGVHLLTAGTTLCILASLEPLSRESHESKIGVQRLMHMQTTVGPRSVLAAQGLEILKKLIALIMEKELAVLLASPRRPTASSCQPAAQRDFNNRDSTRLTQDTVMQCQNATARMDANQTEQPTFLNEHSVIPEVPSFATETFCDAEYGYYENQNIIQAISNAEEGEDLLAHFLCRYSLWLITL